MRVAKPRVAKLPPYTNPNQPVEKIVRNLLWSLILLALAGGPAGCRMPDPTPAPALALDSSAVTPLPPPALEGDISLERALALRRSVRSFDDTPLTMQELGQLLWAAQGVTDERGLRTAPSAGALYPLEIYVVTATGTFHYLPAGHNWQITVRQDARPALYEAALRQDPVRQAPAVFVIAAVYERTSGKYGERAARYVHLEAGHAAQNLLLQAVALDLAVVPMGAFDDDQVRQALALPPDHQPLYLIPVGHPRAGGG